MEWKRFDDDVRTALSGVYLWEALVEGGRATHSRQLAGSYVRTLLERLGRDLTLKEVVQQFYKNPMFPMVANVDDIRRAIFELVQSDFEIVGGDGERLAPASADDLSIGAVDQTLRKISATRERAAAHTARAGNNISGPAANNTGPCLGTQGDSAVFRRYTMELPNRSLASVDARRIVANLLQALLDAVDPDLSNDGLELIDMRIDLTATENAVQDVSDKASAAGARWQVQELDF